MTRLNVAAFRAALVELRARYRNYANEVRESPRHAEPMTLAAALLKDIIAALDAATEES